MLLSILCLNSGLALLIPHGELDLLQLCLHGGQLGLEGADGWIRWGRCRTGGRTGRGGGWRHGGLELVDIARESATVLGFFLLQLPRLGFHGALDLHLHGRLDGRQVGGGRSGGDGGRGVRLEGGEDAELAQLFGPELIPRPSEPAKAVIKVADPLMQVVPLDSSLGQPVVSVPGERVDYSTQVAHEGHGLLLHVGGLGGEASVVGGQGVELLPLLLHVDGFKGG